MILPQTGANVENPANVLKGIEREMIYCCRLVQIYLILFSLFYFIFILSCVARSLKGIFALVSDLKYLLNLFIESKLYIYKGVQRSCSAR